MTFWRSVLFGLVQGLTEFLPVSSSGHLILLERMSLAPTSVFLNLTLHAATLLSVLIVMRKEVWSVIRHPIRSDLKYVCLSSFPTVAIALFFSAYAPALLEGSLLSFCFLATSAFLLLAEMLAKGERREIGVGRCLIVGAVQGLAVVPGLSRSGSTISALRLLGVEEERATAFSFLLSIPVIVGAFLYEGFKTGFSVAGTDLPEVLIAAITAFITGIFAAKFMLGNKKKGYMPFILYTLGLGIVSFFLL